MIVEQNWALAPQNLQLNDDEVHVWQASLEGDTTDLQNLLSIDERERANRFHFDEHRQKFIIARGTLRLILARYLACQPQSIKFNYNAHGKPALAEPFNEIPLQFNLSHTHTLALYGVTLKKPIGIDVEYTQRAIEINQIAKHFFSPNETLALNKLPLREQKQAFFNCWTRKEAYIKAKGKGLTIPLDSFDVSLNPQDPAELIEIRNDVTTTNDWALYALNLQKDYVGALVVAGDNHNLSHWRC